MKVTLVARVVDVLLADAPTVTGMASYSGKVRTIRPVRASVRWGSDPDVARVTLHGPQVRANGAETAAHFEVKVDVRQGSSDNAQWLRDLVAEVTA